MNAKQAKQIPMNEILQRLGLTKGLGITIIDKSELYAGYKDFNDFLVQNQALGSKQEVE